MSTLKDVNDVQIHDLKFLVNGGQPTLRKSKTDVNIEINTESLKRNAITPMKFLQNLVSNDDDTEAMIQDDRRDDASNDENDNESEDECEENNPNSNNTDDANCVVCYSQRSNVLFLPCRHLKCCIQCVNTIENDHSSIFKCPYCSSPVADKVVAYI